MTERSPGPAVLTVSVVIATFNRPRLLEAALTSLVRQTRQPDEVIVVAWAGDTPTIDLVHNLQRDPARWDGPCRIDLQTTEDNTVTAKENAGVQRAVGDIVCFTDDDAAARLDWLERIVAWYSNPAVGAVGGRDIVQVDGRPYDEPARDVGRIRWFGRLIANHHKRISGVRDVDFLKGVNMSFRKRLLPPIDRSLAGAVPYGFEIDLGLYVRRLGYRIVYDPEIVVDHYSTSDYGASSTIAWTVNHNQTYVLMKHLPATRKLPFLAYTFLLGDRNTIGVLRVPLLFLRDRWPRTAIAMHFRGKLAGLRTYSRSLRAVPERIVT